MLQTKFGDLPSIICVEIDIKRYFYLELLRPLKGANQNNISKLDKRLIRMLQTKFGDHPSISCVEIDI
jgi:hypothetical protein